MAPTRARTSPPPPPPAAVDGVRRPAFHFPANDNRPPFRMVVATVAVVLGILGTLALLFTLVAQ